MIDSLGGQYPLRVHPVAMQQEIGNHDPVRQPKTHTAEGEISLADDGAVQLRRAAGNGRGSPIAEIGKNSSAVCLLPSVTVNEKTTTAIPDRVPPFHHYGQSRNGHELLQVRDQIDRHRPLTLTQ